MKALQVDLKACLGLVLPSQYYLIIERDNLGWFLGDVILWATPTPLWSLLYSTYIYILCMNVCMCTVLNQFITFTLENGGTNQDEMMMAGIENNQYNYVTGPGKTGLIAHDSRFLIFHQEHI